ncbi:MAG: type IV pilin N-terminal domain-containing protein [Methanomicrobium sp.]|nr:type IV pilin N-terminal domain-containing protein [Methanomicrobium sp.]
MRKIFSNALFEAKERESAVSPVVGVMLMLVVTIIIAATVSAFAGGLVGTSEKAPQAAFDVKIVAGSYGPDQEDIRMTISHIGGDAIDTARTKVITSWANKTNPEVVNFRETTALPFSETPQEYMTGKYVNLSLTDANVNYTKKYQEPYFVIPKDMPADGEGEEVSLWFGNFILHAGEVMKVESSTSYWNTNGYNDHSVIKNAKMLTGKDVVNVKLIDIPTGTVIFEKDVYVTEA